MPSGPTLLVEGGQEPARTLVLGSRNLHRVELMVTKEVHPYDLLRYERAIFSRGRDRAIAGDVEEDCIPAQARSRCGGGLMPTLYNVIRRPLITEKGLGVRKRESTLVFEVAPDATKTEVKQAVETLCSR